MKRILGIILILLTTPVWTDGLPEGYWDEESADAILDQTSDLTLSPDLSGLEPDEQQMVGLLLKVGGIFQQLHERTVHVQNEEALDTLKDLQKLGIAPQNTEKLLRLHRLFKGPIATTLTNERVSFLPVSPEVDGKNFYPAGTTREELDAYMQAHPEERDALMHVRSLVRRGDSNTVTLDLAALDRHPVLEGLHPGLRDYIEDAGEQQRAFYAVPYAVAFADELVRSHQLLRRAAKLASQTDPDFSVYLANRARDLLTNDYESGDASWVRGRFGRFNAQIGSYETYDDTLYGVKSAFSFSLLKRDDERTATLRKSMAGIQALEDRLPYDNHKKVQEDIPVGVYEIIADFGQSRSANTATILPNSSDHARKYGRTILLRYNIMTNETLFDRQLETWRPIVGEEFADDLTPQGQFNRTLWHEVGHYLGPAQDRNGNEHQASLSPYGSAFEEMKADLVSLFSAKYFHLEGEYDDATLRAIYAGGIKRVVQSVKPRSTQPYQTMQLMQWNYFIENGLLIFNPESGRFQIDYENYHQVIDSLLTEILAIQYGGDAAVAATFVDKYTNWNEELHGISARKIRDAAPARYTSVHYAVID